MSHRMEREAIKKAYPSKRWAEQVDKMTDGQVVAVWMRLRAKGKV